MIHENWIRAVRCSLTQALIRYQHLHGKRPAMILTEGDAYSLLIFDPENSRFLEDGRSEWRGIPVKRIEGKGKGIYLPVEPVEIVMVEPNSSLVFHNREDLKDG